MTGPMSTCRRWEVEGEGGWYGRESREERGWKGGGDQEYIKGAGWQGQWALPLSIIPLTW